MSKRAASLDREVLITPDRVTAAFQRGVSSRKNRVGMSGVPYKDATLAEAWERGWRHQDKIQKGIVT